MRRKKVLFEEKVEQRYGKKKVFFFFLNIRNVWRKASSDTPNQQMDLRNFIWTHIMGINGKFLWG